MTGPRGCDLGYEEHDGFRYCFVHFGFRHPGAGVSWCDRAPKPDDFARCGARASDVPALAAEFNTDTWAPCMLNAGHGGGHWSTSGCAGGEVRWG